MATITEHPVTVAFEELEGSPREQGGEADFRATRSLKCAWSDRLALADELLRGFEVSSGGRTMLVGQRYPHRERVHAVAVKVEPLDRRVRAQAGDTRLASYDWAKLTVRYEPRDLGVPLEAGESAEVRLAEETLSTSVELAQAPGRRLYWGVNQPIEVDESPAVVSRLAEWTYALRAVASLPASWSLYAGHVNSAPVSSASLGVTFEAESLLYHGFEARRVITSRGAQAWDVKLRFTHRPGAGWNQFRKAGNAAMQPLFTDAAATTRYRPYPLADLGAGLGLA